MHFQYISTLMFYVMVVEQYLAAQAGNGGKLIEEATTIERGISPCRTAAWQWRKAH